MAVPQIILFTFSVFSAVIILYINMVALTHRLPRFTSSDYWKFIRCMGCYFPSHRRRWTENGAFSEEEAKRIMTWQLAAQLEMFVGSIIVAVALGSMLGL
jgi:hypothetical protein